MEKKLNNENKKILTHIFPFLSENKKDVSNSEFNSIVSKIQN